MLKNLKSGFTLLEIMVAITVFGIIGTGIVSLLVFGLDTYKLANVDYQFQSDLRMGLEGTSKIIGNAKALFAVPGDYLDDEWDYIILNKDKTAIVQSVWDPINKVRVETPMVGPYEGVTFNIAFFKEDSMKKDNTIQVYFEMIKADGNVSRFSIETGYEALNALQVVDYGTESHPAKALAYRNDKYEYENYKLYVNIALVLDTSGSMGSKIKNSDAKNKITILKDKTKSLIESFAQNTNDDVIINISLVPFSDSGNKISSFMDVKNATSKTALINSVNNMKAEGGTNIGDGMRRAYYKLIDINQAQDSAEAGSERDYIIKNYVIFLTDGEPTYNTIERICVKANCNNDKSFSNFPYFGTLPIKENWSGVVHWNDTNLKTEGIYIDGSGGSTGTGDKNYITNVGKMYCGLSATGTEKCNDKGGRTWIATSYIIAFAQGANSTDFPTSIINLAQSTMPKLEVGQTKYERVYPANSEDELALQFTNIQLSITNDTWHYLGPKLVK